MEGNKQIYCALEERRDQDGQGVDYALYDLGQSSHDGLYDFRQRRH